MDVFFDNVGGEILDAALTRLARGRPDRHLRRDLAVQRRAACAGPANYMALLVQRASMTGMVVFDYADRYGEAAAEIAGWLREGKLVSREEIVSGRCRGLP